MPPRIKKLVGFAALLPILGLYFFAAAALGEFVPNNQLLKVAFYLIAGIAWAFPVKYLMFWMNAEQPSQKSAPNRE